MRIKTEFLSYWFSIYYCLSCVLFFFSSGLGPKEAKTSNKVIFFATNMKSSSSFFFFFPQFFWVLQPDVNSWYDL